MAITPFTDFCTGLLFLTMTAVLIGVVYWAIKRARYTTQLDDRKTLLQLILFERVMKNHNIDLDAELKTLYNKETKTTTEIVEEEMTQEYNNTKKEARK